MGCIGRSELVTDGVVCLDLWECRDAFRERGGSTSAEKLAAELVDLVGKTGKARMRREEMHKIAEVNKGYAHFVKWS